MSACVTAQITMTSKGLIKRRMTLPFRKQDSPVGGMRSAFLIHPMCIAAANQTSV